MSEHSSQATKKRYTSKSLNSRDLEIVHSQLIEGDSNVVTAEKVGCSERTVRRTKQKQAYRDLVIAQLAEIEYDAATYAKNMVAHTKAEKKIRFNGEDEKVPDTKHRLIADMKLGDVFGVEAPKEFDLKHSMAAMSDDELLQEIDKSTEELNGRFQHHLTGPPNAASTFTHQVIKQEPGVAGESGQQGDCTADDRTQS
jgi:hypothetical protein